MPRRSRTTRIGMTAAALTLAADLAACAAPAPASDWVHAFRYDDAAIHSVHIGRFGYPYVEVQIGDTTVWLPFDTGNTVGLTVSTALFDRLGLNAAGTYDRVNSAGETTASLRIADAVDVAVLGRDVSPTRVYEFDLPSLDGLAGPVLIGGGHFTLDYATRRIAVSTGPLPDSVPGFRRLPLIRSSRHPTLILVRATVEGREVLIELDTGKSRTVINPNLATDLGLKRVAGGVAIDHVGIGDLRFQVPSAKEVDQRGIDPSLPEPILAGIGSDILSRFVWTADYDAGVLWIPVAQ